VSGKYTGSRFGGFKDSRPEDEQFKRSPERSDEDYYQNKYQKGQDGYRVSKRSPSGERSNKPRLLDDPMASLYPSVKQESGIQDHLVKNEYPSYSYKSLPVKQELDPTLLGHLAFGDCKEGNRKLVESQ